MVMLIPSLLCRPRATGLIAVALAVGLAPLAQQRALAQARGSAPSSTAVPQSQRVDPSASVQLKVRRLPDAVELVIEGTGPAPQLQQGLQGDRWQGQLTTARPAMLRMGPQRLALPEVGFQSISFDGGGTSFALAVTPSPGITLGRPVVSADGSNLILTFASPVPQASLQVSRANALQPGAVPLPSYAPPLQPRAVAPPLGDMAVGSMVLRNPGYVQLSGPPVTMTLKNAPAKDALMALAQLGGYGFVYVPHEDPAKEKESCERTGLLAQGSSTGAASLCNPVSLSFASESYSSAFNSALLAARLTARLQGRTVFAGPDLLAVNTGPVVSRVYRLNQVGPIAAADYLAQLGAQVSIADTITTSVTQGITGDSAVAGGEAAQTTDQTTRKFIQTYGASKGPLLGLNATPDPRLGTLALVGDPAVVGVAEQYLRQLDLRQRQVALNVKILDVNLENTAEIENSFAIRWGDNFIVSDNGQLLGAFGSNLPPGANSFRRDLAPPLEQIGSSSERTASLNRGASRALTVNRSRGLSLTDSQIQEINNELESIGGFKIEKLSGDERLEIIQIDGESTNFTSRDQRKIERILSRVSGKEITTSRAFDRARNSRNTRSSDVAGSRRPNPGSFYDSNSFFDFVRAQIVSGSTKLLASPTLILQENPAELRETADSSGSQQGGLDEYSIESPIGRRRANEGVVRVGTNVPTKVSVNNNNNSGTSSCDIQELTTAGLVLGARIEKIDDNGFVTFALSPSVSAVVDELPAGSGCPPISILAVRRLDTGALRVRDGQTLILTGVISETDRQVVTKWPILGDIPIIGQFFRSTSSSKEKRELVIMVTPRIVGDDQGGIYGYGYRPSSGDARGLLGGTGAVLR